MKSAISLMLEKKAQQFDALALATKDEFNKGYFEGKAEMARAAHAAIDYMTQGDKRAAQDVLDGDL